MLTAIKNKNNSFFCLYLKYLTSVERYQLQMKTNLKDAKMRGAVRSDAINMADIVDKNDSDSE